MLLCSVHLRFQFIRPAVAGANTSSRPSSSLPLHFVASLPPLCALCDLCGLCGEISYSAPFSRHSRPLSFRWRLVVAQREMLPIPFPFRPLRRSFLHNEGGTPPSTDFSLSPKPSLPLSIPLTPLVCYSCELFCTRDFRNCFRFNQFRTLAPKPPGWVSPSP